MKNTITYGFFYALGILLGLGLPAESLTQSLNILEPVALTALVASLLIPFAGLSANERWNKLFLQYGIIPLFGAYTLAMWENSQILGVVFFALGAGMHFAYWTSSLHSRGYRLNQFRLGFGRLEKTLQTIAMLNGRGNSHVADEALVVPILNGGKPNLGDIQNFVPENLFKEIRTELENFV